jgi:hypothetical protein
MTGAMQPKTPLFQDRSSDQLTVISLPYGLTFKLVIENYLG